MQLRIQRLTETAVLPCYAHDGDAGLDLFACESVDIDPGRAKLIRTGIALELPAGTEAQVRPRSGLALDFSVTVLNAPGTIDEGYRGEIQVLLVNFGIRSFCVEQGMKVAQLVVAGRVRVEVQEVAALNSTSRGMRGFGSTGR